MSQGSSTAAVVALLGLVALWTWALQLLLVGVHRHAAGALGSLTRLLLALWGAGPVAAGLALAAFAAEPVAFVVLGAFTAVATALVTLPPRLLADRLFRRRPFEPRVRRAGVALLAAVIGAIVAVQLWPTSPCGALGQPPCRVSGGPGLAGWAGFLLFVGSAQLLVWERCMHSSPFASRHNARAAEA